MVWCKCSLNVFMSVMPRPFYNSHKEQIKRVTNNKGAGTACTQRRITTMRMLGGSQHSPQRCMASPLTTGAAGTAGMNGCQAALSPPRMTAILELLPSRCCHPCRCPCPCRCPMSGPCRWWWCCAAAGRSRKGMSATAMSRCHCYAMLEFCLEHER
jgi:hypothetical protein